VIADPDGDYLQRFYDPGRGDIILNPFDERSARWDLFAEITVRQDADQLARSVIPDYDGKDHIWTGFARTYVSSILRQLHRVEERNLAKLYHLLVQATEPELRDLLQGTPASRFIGKEGGKFLESVQSVTNQHLGVTRMSPPIARTTSSASDGGSARAGESCSYPTAPTKSQHCRLSSAPGCASPSLKP